jgi:hypothetical protein
MPLSPGGDVAFAGSGCRRQTVLPRNSSGGEVPLLLESIVSNWL